jgi:hypothetical protein
MAVFGPAHLQGGVAHEARVPTKWVDGCAACISTALCSVGDPTGIVGRADACGQIWLSVR